MEKDATDPQTPRSQAAELSAKKQADSACLVSLTAALYRLGQDGTQEALREYLLNKSAGKESKSYLVQPSHLAGRKPRPGSGKWLS